jgi:hypothetical protein
MPLGASRFGLLGGVADLGKLELIETQSVSSVSQVDFTSIAESTYNVHFAVVDININSAGTSVNLRFFENGVLETGSVYQYAYQNGQATGTFSETKSTSGNSLFATRTGGTDEPRQAYNYFYNLGDSSKYSFQTMQGVSRQSPTTALDMRFGSGVLPQASTVDGLRFTETGGGLLTGTISLYGIAES